MLFSSPWAFAPIGEGKESVKPFKNLQSTVEDFIMARDMIDYWPKDEIYTGMLSAAHSKLKGGYWHQKKKPMSKHRYKLHISLDYDKNELEKVSLALKIMIAASYILELPEFRSNTKVHVNWKSPKSQPGKQLCFYIPLQVEHERLRSFVQILHNLFVKNKIKPDVRPFNSDKELFKIDTLIPKEAPSEPVYFGYRTDTLIVFDNKHFDETKESPEYVAIGKVTEKGHVLTGSGKPENFEGKSIEYAAGKRYLVDKKTNVKTLYNPIYVFDKRYSSMLFYYTSKRSEVKKSIGVIRSSFWISNVVPLSVHIDSVDVLKNLGSLPPFFLEGLNPFKDFIIKR